MGRKHRNASQREHTKLSVRGVKVQYSRIPSIVLDMQGFGIWEHAVALGASLWCRDRYSSSVGVNFDPYGIWQACRFIVTSAGNWVRPRFDEEISGIVTSAVRDAVRSIGRKRGFSDEMINRSVREVTMMPLPVASFWHTVSLISGSLDRVAQAIVMFSNDFRPVWLVPYRIEHQVRTGLPPVFLLMENGVHDAVITSMKRMSVPVVFMDSSTPHEFVAAARASGCLGVVSHTLDGLSLGYSATDRCYQVVTEGMDPSLVLMAPHLRIVLSEGQVQLPSALLTDLQVFASS